MYSRRCSSRYRPSLKERHRWVPEARRTCTAPVVGVASFAIGQFAKVGTVAIPSIDNAATGTAPVSAI